MNFCCDQRFPDTRNQVDKRHQPFPATYCVRRFRWCDNEMCRVDFAIREAWEAFHFPQPQSHPDFPSVRVGCSSILTLDKDLPLSEFQGLACIPGALPVRARVDTRSASNRFEELVPGESRCVPYCL